MAKSFEDVLKALREAAQRASEGRDGDGDDGLNLDSGYKERNRQLKSAVSDADMIRSLKAGYALFHEEVNLKPGDIIRGKKELTSHMIKYWDRPHIVLEILETPVVLALSGEDAADCSSCKRYDMIIGAATMRSDPSLLLRFYADAREWELFPDADKIGKADQ